MRVPNKQISKKEYEYLVCQAAARGTFYERYKAQHSKSKKSTDNALKGSESV